MNQRHLDNPAGRLHYWLGRLQDSMNPSQSIRQAWIHAIGLEGDDYRLRVEIGRVAGLIPQLADLLETTDPGHLETFKHNVDAWSMPILLWGRKLDSAIQQEAGNIVQPAPMAALYTLAALLSAVAPEGVVPPGEKREELLASLRELEEDVRTAEIADDLRDLLQMHLVAMKKAIRDVMIGGPLPVRTEGERFVGTCVVHQHQLVDDNGARHPVVNKALTVFGTIYLIFTASPTMVSAINAWQDLTKMLPGK